MRKTLYIIALAIIVFALLNQCNGNNDKEFNLVIKSLENQRDSLLIDNRLKNKDIKALNVSILKNKTIFDSLVLRSKIITKKRNEISNIINSLVISEIDSTLSNYRHPVRQ
tara:strand:+ start:213 stop:545 length:333 start_codon:yes stop_codon:yes gene_type:complete